MKVMILKEQVIRKTEKAYFINFINEEPQYQSLCLCLPLQYMQEDAEDTKRLIMSIPKNALILPKSSLEGKYLQQALTPGKFKGMFEDEVNAYIETSQVKLKDNIAEILFPLDKSGYKYLKLTTEKDNLKLINLENAEGETTTAYEFKVTSAYQMSITLNNDEKKLARLLSTVEPLEDKPSETWKKVG